MRLVHDGDFLMIDIHKKKEDMGIRIVNTLQVMENRNWIMWFDYLQKSEKKNDDKWWIVIKQLAQSSNESELNQIICDVEYQRNLKASDVYLDIQNNDI